MHTCIVCGEIATLGDSLCDTHEGLADLWSAVNGGILSDWGRGNNHVAMMLHSRPAMWNTWRIQLKYLLASRLHILDDGADSGE